MQRHPAYRGRARGFTVVEVLVLLAIVLVLAGILLPAVQMARGSARRVSCANNLRQLALAMQNHVATLKKYPYASKTDVVDAYTWYQHLMPYLDREDVFKGFTTIQMPVYPTHPINNDWPFAHPFGTAPALIEARSAAIKSYACPADVEPIVAETWYPYYTRIRGSYRGCVGPGDIYGNAIVPGGPAGRGVFTVVVGQMWQSAGLPPLQTRPVDITDGASVTLLLSEGLMPTTDRWVGTMGDINLANMGGAHFSAYLPPNATEADEIRGPCPQDEGDTGYTAPCTSLGPILRPQAGHSAGNQARAHAAARSRHIGGVNAALADGAVRFVASTITRSVWQALATRAGREAVSPDAY